MRSKSASRAASASKITASEASAGESSVHLFRAAQAVALLLREVGGVAAADEDGDEHPLEAAADGHPQEGSAQAAQAQHLSNEVRDVPAP